MLWKDSAPKDIWVYEQEYLPTLWFWGIVMCEYFFGHVVSAIIATQNRPLPQGTGLSRSRMQNSVAILYLFLCILQAVLIP